MHPLEADWTAEHIEETVGLTGPTVRATCLPVPLRPGFQRRRCRWAFLLLTDGDEHVVREALGDVAMEFVANKDPDRVYVLWPQEGGPVGHKATV